MIILILSMLLMLMNKSRALTVNDNQDTEQPLNLNTSIGNWTTCEEFLEGTTFDEKRLLDVDWKVFYMWYEDYEDPYLARFRVPTQMLVDRFKEEIDKITDKEWRPININWNETEFFMETTIDLSALFFRTNTPGKFHVLSSLIFQYRLDQEVIFAMKIVEPGYFAYMNCKDKLGAAFAPVDMMPKDNELIQAAKLFKMRNPMGFPHNAHSTLPDVPHVVESNDDVDDEEEMEVQMHGGSIID